MKFIKFLEGFPIAKIEKQFFKRIANIIELSVKPRD
jgi:hypothetical protein